MKVIVENIIKFWMEANLSDITLLLFRKCHRRVQLTVKAEEDPSFFQRVGLMAYQYYFKIKARGLLEEECEWKIRWKDLRSFYCGVGFS